MDGCQAFKKTKYAAGDKETPGPDPAPGTRSHRSVFRVTLIRISNQRLCQYLYNCQESLSCGRCSKSMFVLFHCPRESELAGATL